MWGLRVWMLVAFTALAWPGALLSTDDYYALTTGYPLLDFSSPEPSLAIGSIADIPRVLAALYTSWSGRLLLHLIVQLYLNCLGYGALALTIGILTTWAVELIASLATASHNPSTGARIAAAALFLAVMPLFGLNGVWFGNASFALNYALPGAVSLWVLRQMQAERPSLHPWLMGVIALGAGALQEGFSIAVSVPMVIWVAYRFRRLTAAHLALAAGYIAGTLILCAAPGNLHRVAVSSGAATYTPAALAADLYSIIETAIPVVALGALLVWVALRKQLRQWWAEQWPCAAGAAANVAFCICVVRFYGYARPLEPAGLMIVVMSTAALARLGVRFTSPWQGRAVAFLTAVCAFWFGTGRERAGMYHRTVESWLSAPDGIVVLPDRAPVKSGCPYAVWGPEPPNPWNPDFFNRTDHYKFSHYYGLPDRPLHFVPEGLGSTAGSSIKVHIAGADSAATVTHAPESWWVAVSGLDTAKTYSAEASAYTSRRLIPRIKKVLGMSTVYYPALLRTDRLPSGELIIYLDYDLAIDSITLR